MPGDRIRGLASAVAYALLTRRAVFVDWPGSEDVFEGAEGAITRLSDAVWFALRVLPDPLVLRYPRTQWIPVDHKLPEMCSNLSLSQLMVRRDDLNGDAEQFMRSVEQDELIPIVIFSSNRNALFKFGQLAAYRELLTGMRMSTLFAPGCFQRLIAQPTNATLALFQVYLLCISSGQCPDESFHLLFLDVLTFQPWLHMFAAEPFVGIHIRTGDNVFFATEEEYQTKGSFPPPADFITYQAVHFDCARHVSHAHAPASKWLVVSDQRYVRYAANIVYGAQRVPERPATATAATVDLSPQHINYVAQPSSWNATRRATALLAAFGEHWILSHATALILPRSPQRLSGYSAVAAQRALSRGGFHAPAQVWSAPMPGTPDPRCLPVAPWELTQMLS